MKQKTKKILGYSLQIPAILLLIASFFASVYAYLNKIQEITIIIPIIFFIVLLCYFIGRLIIYKNINKSNTKEEKEDNFKY